MQLEINFVLMHEIIFEPINYLGEKEKRVVLKTLTNGDVFGEMAFFTGTLRGLPAVSKEFSSVCKISRNEFIELLNHFPLDKVKYYVTIYKEKYKYMAD